MNAQEIASLINKTAKALEAGEKLPVPVLAVKARQAAQQRPNDVTLVTASHVLSKMAEQKTFITRAEFNQIYDKIYVSGTKMAEVFAEELQRPELPKPQTFTRSDDEGQSLDRDFERVADPLLSNALSAMFEGRDEPYSAKASKQAQKAAEAGLAGAGVTPKRIDTFAGRGDILICQAHIETPKGYSQVLVPIEFKQGRPLLPTMFISQMGATDLRAELLQHHIKATAGKSLRVNGEQLLDVLAEAKHGTKKIASAVELAAIKVNARKEAAPHDPCAIVYQKVDPQEDQGVQLPEPKLAKEHYDIAGRLNKADGQARFIHNDRVVEAGRDMIIRRMAQMGHRSAQVKVAEVDEKKIYYAVSLGVTAGFKVPVEVRGNLVVPPKVVIADGQLQSFSKAGIAEVLKNGYGDKRMLAVASPQFEQTTEQLVAVVKQAVHEGNLAAAEDAINVLGEKDPQAQKVAIAIFMRSITPEGDNSELLDKLANTEVKEVPYFMAHNVFFPKGV